jgi:uncharacterized protein (DUF983 family)
MATEERQTQTGLVVPGIRQTARLFGRALLLRCPNCGRGPVLEHWLKLRVRCGTCGLRLQRGEHDYFIGSMMILFVLAGSLLLGVLVVTLLVTWPAVPWDLLQNGLPILMLVALPALFPFSKLLWLAFDLMLRPVSPEELDWHRAAAGEWSTGEDEGR